MSTRLSDFAAQRDRDSRKRRSLMPCSRSLTHVRHPRRVREGSRRFAALLPQFAQALTGHLRNSLRSLRHRALITLSASRKAARPSRTTAAAHALVHETTLSRGPRRDRSWQLVCVQSRSFHASEPDEAETKIETSEHRPRQRRWRVTAASVRARRSREPALPTPACRFRGSHRGASPVPRGRRACTVSCRTRWSRRGRRTA